MTSPGQPLAALLVDDDVTDSELLVHELRRAGYALEWRRVDRGDDIAAALADRAWDVVLCDFNLPGYSVERALELLAEVAPDTPLVVVSGVIDEVEAVELLKSGAQDVVLKSNLARLAPVMKRTLEESSERKRRIDAERALKSAIDHLELAQEVAGMASWDRDAETLDTRWRSGFEGLFGPDVASVGAPLESFLEHVHPDDRVGLRDAMAECVRTGAGYTSEFRLLHADGTVQRISSRGVVLGGDRNRLIGVSIDVTEQRAAEEALRIAHGALTAVVEGSPAAIFVVDRELRVTSWNPAAEALLGWSADDVRGRSLPRAGCDELDALFARALAGEVVAPVEAECRRKDGAPVAVNISLAPLFDDGGRPSAVVATLLDDGPRRARARHQEALLRLGAGLLTHEPDEFLTGATGAMAEALAVDLLVVFAAGRRDAEAVLRTGVGLQEGCAGRGSLSLEPGSYGEYALRQGDALVVEDFAADRRFAPPALLADHGVVAGASVVVRLGNGTRGLLGAYFRTPRTLTEDELRFLQAAAATVSAVVEHMYAARQLRDAEEKYRTLVEQIPAVTYVDLAEPIATPLYVSPQVETILGISPEEWMRSVGLESWLGLLHPDDREANERATRRLVNEGEPLDMEVRVVRRDQQMVWAREQARLLPGEGDRPALVHGVILDITAVKAAEARLEESLALLRFASDDRRRLLGALVQAQEEERRRLSDDIHDDWVQVMTAVALRLDLLHGRTEDAGAAAEIEQLAAQVRDAVGRLRTLVFELRPPALDRDGLAAAVRLLLEERRNGGGTPVIELDDRLVREPAPVVRAVAYRIIQEAMTNVVRHSRASTASVALDNRDGGVLVDVVDDGVGFDVDAAEPLGGHVGLISMRERAELAGGWWRIASAPAEGTTVEFWLPDRSAATDADEDDDDDEDES